MSSRCVEISKIIEDGCTECGACVKRCAFLQRYGTPYAIAKNIDCSSSERLGFSYECSLCLLCDAVCPEKIKPSDLFLGMRRTIIERGDADLSRYSRLIAYEKKGVSKRFSWYSMPEGCDTVFFPGCSLSGSRAASVLNLYEKMREKNPSLGIVLDCCTKPSHDLGRDEYFKKMFGELREYLLSKGIKRVITGCQNCYKVFKSYGDPLEPVSLYSELEDLDIVSEKKVTGVVTVHDPCVTRYERDIHQSVRNLVARSGLEVENPRQSGKLTNCCGEGGGVLYLDKTLANSWREKCVEAAGGRRVVTYCAGCDLRLSPVLDSSHVVDLVLDPEAALSGRTRVARSPKTYYDRLQVLKKGLKKSYTDEFVREREIGDEAEKTLFGKLKPLFMVAILALLMLFVRNSGLLEYFERERINALVESYGIYGPMIFVALYAITPPLFLPAVPMTVVAGILFGPLWGVVYVTIGANVGAWGAFLISRYFAREWVEGRLLGSKWRELDEKVAKNGWKVVAFTRLIPLFPFNMLNYAFGITKIPFSHYAITSLICMIPGTVAYVVFSSSLLDLFKGKASPQFIIGLALVAAVSLLPIIYKKVKSKKGEG